MTPVSPGTFRLDGSVAVLGIDDGKVNALSPRLIGAIQEGLDRAESEAGSVLIHGRPGLFSAGFDLAVMQGDPGQRRNLVAAGVDLLLRIFEFPRPVVTACTGHAVAAGAMILLAADVRIGAAGDYKVGLNEVGIGMHLPIFAVELARSRLSPSHLVPATLHATMYEPESAVEAGYLDRLVDPALLLDAARADAGRLAELDQEAYADSKRRLRRRVAEHIRDTLSEDLDAMTRPA